MSANDLVTKTCKPCEGGVEPMSPEDVRAMLSKTPGWQADAESKVIARTWTLADFNEAMAFANRVADIAEAEQHHPDLFIHGYKHVTVSLTTHAIGGLSENDFIVAAKIDTLRQSDA